MSRFTLKLFVFLAGLVFAGLLSAQTIQINRENKTIAISTTDEATSVADIACVTVGFEVFGPDSETAYVAGSKISHAVVETLHKSGVEDKSIESSGQSLERNNNFDDKETPEERGKEQFVFHQSWEVSVSPRAAAEVIRASVASGANKSGAIDWRLSDRKLLQEKAAEAALIKARGVAANMAEGLHVKLGALIYASNETPNTKIYFARPQNRFALNAQGSSVASQINLLPALEIRPQTIREEATVYAVFAIE